MLHGFDARTHGPIAPGVKKILGDFDMGEGPESLEVFPKKISPDRRQIQFKKFGETDRLFLCEVLGAFENSPSAVCQKILLSGRLEFGNLQAPNLIDGLSELLHDVEPVENVQGLRSFLRNDFHIRMPHVAANEPELGGTFFSEHAEEPEKGLDLSFRPTPEKPPEPGIELIDHSEVLVPFEYGDLVDSNLGHALEGAVCHTIVDNHFDGPENASPSLFRRQSRPRSRTGAGPIGPERSWWSASFSLSRFLDSTVFSQTSVSKPSSNPNPSPSSYSCSCSRAFSPKDFS